MLFAAPAAGADAFWPRTVGRLCTLALGALFLAAAGPAWRSSCWAGRGEVEEAAEADAGAGLDWAGAEALAEALADEAG